MLCLKHLEHGKALAGINAIVLSAVDDQHWGLEVCRVGDGRLVDERLRVVPWCPLELLHRSTDKVARVEHRHEIEQAIVRNNCAKPVRVPFDPIGHITTGASYGGYMANWVEG